MTDKVYKERFDISLITNLILVMEECSRKKKSESNNNNYNNSQKQKCLGTSDYTKKITTNSVSHSKYSTIIRPLLKESFVLLTAILNNIL